MTARLLLPAALLLCLAAPISDTARAATPDAGAPSAEDERPVVRPGGPDRDPSDEPYPGWSVPAGLSAG